MSPESIEIELEELRLVTDAAAKDDRTLGWKADDKCAAKEKAIAILFVLIVATFSFQLLCRYGKESEKRTRKEEETFFRYSHSHASILSSGKSDVTLTAVTYTYVLCHGTVRSVSRFVL